MLNQEKLFALLIGLGTVSLTACANTGAAYMPIVDGPMGAKYTQDIADCRSLAEQRKLLNGESKEIALLAAGLTGLSILADDKDNDLGDALLGAVIGGAVGAGAGAMETRDERKQMMKTCMAGRGHRVVG